MDWRQGLKQRGARLNRARKDLIREFRRAYVETEIGSQEWCLRLFQFMRRNDRGFDFSDVQRWMDVYPWITAPLEGKPEVFTVTPGRTYQSAMAALTSESDFRECNASLRIPANESIIFRDCLSTATSTNLPMPFHAGSVVNDHIMAPLRSQAPVIQNVEFNEDISSNASTTTMSHEQFKTKCFMTAFQAIADLHEVCKQLPEVRVCLLPLKEIHRVFARNHEKFIFPTDYTQISALNAPVIKLDSSPCNSPVQHYAQGTIDVEND